MNGKLARVLDGNPLLFGVAAIGFSVSFETVSHLATAHRMPGWPVLYPLGLDVAILAMTIEARHLIRLRKSDAVPRVIAWLLTGATVYANVHGSAPHDWTGRALHAVMPCLWVVGLELTRRRMIAAEVERRDKIPPARWLLAPLSTFWLWRWMVLWQITSYSLALAREQERRRAIAALRARHGRRWKGAADSSVVWQLVHGIDVEGATEAVRALVPAPAPDSAENDARSAAEKTAGDGAQQGPEKPAENPAGSGAEKPVRKPSRAQAKKMTGTELAPYVGTLLEADPDLTQTAVMDDLHIGIAKAREALRIAKRDRVTPIGLHRSAGE